MNKNILILKFFPDLAYKLLTVFCFINFSLPITSIAIDNKSQDLLNKYYLKNILKTDYILWIQDVLKNLISRKYQELTTQVRISSDSTVYLPKLQRVYVSSLTIDELTKLLNLSRVFYLFRDL